ncbi:ABC transporter permease, partial [Candidatus Saccharibacteria bacterium]|nr:ABC transporter permease [Candidatus Saccharibacteria bacterium]
DFSELSENNLKVTVDTSEYDNISSSIESVSSFADTILIIVIIASIIIITLIVTINVKDRRYEIGVLMSLGADKKNVIGQIATELLLIGTFGFLLAFVTGTALAGVLSDHILESQVASSAEQSEKNFGRPGAGVGNMPGDSSNNSRKNQSSKTTDMPEMPNSPSDLLKNRNETNVELDLNAKPEDYLLLFLTGYLVIILALILPSVSIMRYQPKEILAGKE